jgi:hypothetical protein
MPAALSSTVLPSLHSKPTCAVGSLDPAAVLLAFIVGMPLRNLLVAAVLVTACGGKAQTLGDGFDGPRTASGGHAGSGGSRGARDAGAGGAGGEQAAGGSDAGMDVAAPIDTGEETWESSMDGEGQSPPPVDGSADGAVVPAPVRIIRGDPTKTFLTLTIEGHGLTALEGRLVSVRIGRPDRPPQRLGSGQARVENGAFAITFPDVWECCLYKRKLVFIDMDDDGMCTVADKAYSDSRPADQGTVLTVLTLAGSVPPDPDPIRVAPDVAAFCQLWAMPWPDL